MFAHRAAGRPSIHRKALPKIGGYRAIFCGGFQYKFQISGQSHTNAVIFVIEREITIHFGIGDIQLARIVGPIAAGAYGGLDIRVAAGGGICIILNWLLANFIQQGSRGSVPPE